MRTEQQQKQQNERNLLNIRQNLDEKNKYKYFYVVFGSLKENPKEFLVCIVFPWWDLGKFMKILIFLLIIAIILLYKILKKFK